MNAGDTEISDSQPDEPGSGDASPEDISPADTGSGDAPTDASTSSDLTQPDSATPDAQPQDAGPPDSATPDASLGDSCGPLDKNPAWQVCERRPGFCGVVFTDKAGCQAVCAAAGLKCARVFENQDNACAKDTTRPELSCDPPTGHGSDYCECAPSGTCKPSCVGKVCGADGCGGSCGSCPAGQQCNTGQCGAPPGENEDCSKYPFKASTLLAERVGFGRNTTGGDPGKIYRVSSLGDSGKGTLRDALESSEPWWIVFDAEGEIRINFDKPISIKSNKTVDGRGRKIHVRNAQFKIDPGTRNLIFSDFEASFIDPKDNVGDLFSLRSTGGPNPEDYPTRNIWFHHLDLHHAGDGLIDVRGGSNITISWNHFHDHTKLMLHTKTTDDKASPGMRITYHHNWFEKITRRAPQFAYGLADFFNNWHQHWYEYGAASIDDAQFLSENNIYEAREGTVCLKPCPDPNPHGGGNDFTVSKKAVVNDWAPDKTVGFVKSVGDRLLNDAKVTVHQPEKVFNRQTYYQAQVDPADDRLKETLRTRTGPRADYCKK
ncbi:MAG: hypothetical protein GMKNLPBB_02295 [Myxococcota bacterium]|nr:hypothetical protein [Myxococcota bacterium]